MIKALDTTVLFSVSFCVCAETLKQNPVFWNSEVEYGVSEKNPVLVGDLPGKGPEKSRYYFRRLTGPDGDRVNFKRLGSCCPFKTSNPGFLGNGFLDIYEVTYDGIEAPVELYLNFYDPREIGVVKGFVFSND